MSLVQMPLTAADQAEFRRPSRVVWLIAATAVIFVLWAAFAWVDEIVQAEGEVISRTRPQILQNLEGGILAELLVSEGDVVEEGQLLGRLQGTQYQSLVDEVGEQIAALEIRRLRIEAEMAGQDSLTVPPELAALVPGIAASEQGLLVARLRDHAARTEGAGAVVEQARQELVLLEKMYKKDVVPLIEVTRARKAYSDALRNLNEAVSADGLERAAEHSKIQNDLAGLRQKRKVAEDQLARTLLVAPLRGVVNKLSLTTIGGVVRPGEEILQIIPLDEALFVEAKVRPRDIAAVRLGQEAAVKLSAYDYTIYGSLPARVTFVSADSFKDEHARDPLQSAYFKVILKVDRASLGPRQESLDFRPGMQATVELETGGKTVLTYLLKPLYKANEALRER